MTDRMLDVAEPGPEDDIPRGPRLPADLEALSATAWAFLLLAVARMIWFLREWDQRTASSLPLAAFVASLIPAVGAVLLPAAVALRHPDAPVRARVLYVGVLLTAFVEGMRVLNAPLRPLFEQASPPDPETPFFIPLAILWVTVAGGAGALGVALIARGLKDQRRYADGSTTRSLVVAVAVVVVLVSLARILALRQLQWDQIPLTPIVTVYIASTIVLGIASIAAWGYLMVSLMAGWRAGEEPEVAWTLAAIGASIVVAALAGNAAVGLVTASEQSQELIINVTVLVSVVFAAGYLALLGGFLLGLPSLADVPVEPDEAETSMDGAGEAVSSHDVEVVGEPSA